MDAWPSWMALHSAPSSTGPSAWAAAAPAPGPCRIRWTKGRACQQAEQTVMTPCSASFTGGEWPPTLSFVGHVCLKAERRDLRQVNDEAIQLVFGQAAAESQGRACPRSGLTSWTGACCSSGRQEGAT